LATREVVEQVVTIVLQEEVDFVKDDDCLVIGEFSFDCVLELGGMVSGSRFVASECVEYPFQGFVLGIGSGAVDVAGCDVGRELFEHRTCEKCFSGAARTVD